MADEKEKGPEMVIVPLIKRTLGLGQGPDRNFYGPGTNIKMPKTTADALGLKYGDDVEEEGEGGEYDSMSVDDLKTTVKNRGLTVEGSGTNGGVLKADLIAALEADDEG